jgi:hypothetical protein
MLYYLASPYTDDDPQVMATRYQIAMTAVALMMKNGKAVYSPIVHWHAVYDLIHLSHCDIIVVLTSTGWNLSRGVEAELVFAKENHITIKYLSPRTGEITDEPTTN